MSHLFVSAVIVNNVVLNRRLAQTEGTDGLLNGFH